MTRFTVNAAELWRMAATVDGLRGQIDDSNNLNRAALDGVGGHPDAEHGYSDFVRHWSDGLWKVRNHLDELSSRLTAAAGAYTKTEASICDAATGGKAQ